jgi:RNA polymerase sigma-70 factor (ECF subfamily)
MTASDAAHDPISERPRLIRLAYRMLGSVSEAEDVVQDAYLRLTAQSPPPRVPAAWLTTVTTRLAIDRLRRIKARRETYPGPWLPDPIETEPSESGPEFSVGMMLVLERLSPEERAAFTLREAFGTPYSEIAASLDKNEPAVRQLISRARGRIRQDRARKPASPTRHAALMQAFVTSVLAGDTDAIKAALREDIVMLTDGGGRRSAALRPIHGRDEVAGLIHFLAGKQTVLRDARIAILNGAAAMVFADRNGDPTTLQIEADEDGISAIYTMRNPEKLAHIGRAECRF